MRKTSREMGTQLIPSDLSFLEHMAAAKRPPKPLKRPTKWRTYIHGSSMLSHPKIMSQFVAQNRCLKRIFSSQATRARFVRISRVKHGKTLVYYVVVLFIMLQHDLAAVQVDVFMYHLAVLAFFTMKGRKLISKTGHKST